MSTFFPPIAEETFPVVFPEIPKQNQSVPIIEEKPEDQLAYEALDDIKKLAVRLRVRLLPYKKIVQRIFEDHEHQYTTQGISEWFIKKGPCYPAFQYWKRKTDAEAEENLKMVAPRIRYAAVEAIGILSEGMIDNSISAEQIRIAQDILDRANFPKITKAENTQNIKSDEFTDMAQSMKSIAEDLHNKK